MPKSAKLGQNFLHDKNIARKILDVFLPHPGPVMEIGAGPGILSSMLLEKIHAARITLVEIDPFLARRLRERFGDPVRVLEKNILEVDLAELFHDPAKVAVIGNLPYHISKELIDWFIAQRAGISKAVFMLQKDFVDKLLAPPGGKKYNAQSVTFQLLFQAHRCFNVPAGAFHPRPKVISTVLAVQPADSPAQSQAGDFFNFVRLCFGERRKTLWNNLSPHCGAVALQAAFAAAAIPAQARAEQLPARTFLEIFLALKANTGQ